MRKLMKAFVRDERGVSAMEYAVLAGIIVVALASLSAFLPGQFQTLFTNMFAKVT
ncbi:pilus assembly protein [Caballeronia novacaledonica]|uniref:Pilus assembly protein n=1 Tax=Caballeronia novacaledonica TaxID=1544861 RepID=A0A2U3HYD1_9BURK|nr:Flp family type IVb pilin [Caballeronia novacaledonica]SPB12802.1 pilus assembly protein [Caballeronia novacaledonica]